MAFQMPERGALNERHQEIMFPGMAGTGPRMAPRLGQPLTQVNVLSGKLPCSTGDEMLPLDRQGRASSVASTVSAGTPTGQGARSVPVPQTPPQVALSGDGNEGRQIVDLDGYVERELMPRKELDELRSMSHSQQTDIAHLAQAFESVQKRMEEMSKENQSLTARVEVNNCKVITLQGEIGTLHSSSTKGGDAPTTEAYVGLAELTANLQRTVEMLESRLESVRSQHEEAFRKTDELLETEVQARAMESQQRSQETLRLQDIERKFANLEQCELDSGRQTNELRSIIDRSQANFQERLDGLQNQIVQLLQDVDGGVQTRSEDASREELNRSEQMEKFDKCLQALESRLKEDTGRYASVGDLQATCQRYDERLALLDEMQSRMTASDQSVANLFEELKTCSSACQRFEASFGDCSEKSELLREQVQTMRPKLDQAIAQAEFMNEDSTLREARIAAVESELEKLKQTSSDMTSACRSKIEELLDRIVLMRTDSEATVTHYNEMEETWRSHFEDLQTRSNSSLAATEDIRRRLNDLDVASQSQFEEMKASSLAASEDIWRRLNDLGPGSEAKFDELQAKLKLVSEEIDSKLSFNIEEIHKQLRLQSETLSARLVDSDSLLSQVEDIRARAEFFATQIPDGDALGLQIDSLRERIEGSVANSVDKDYLNQVIERLHEQSSALQSRYESLQAEQRIEHSDELVASNARLQNVCADLQVQLQQLKASQEDCDGRIDSLQEQSSSIRSASPTAPGEFAEVQGALLGVQARVEESANDVNALRQSLGEMQERLETAQGSGKMSSGLFRMFSRNSSTEQLPENTSVETSGHNNGAFLAELSRLKVEVEEQRRATDSTAFAVQDVQQLVANIQSQTEVLREQMEETLREGGDDDSAAMIDRIDELQSGFESLHGDHVAMMSVAERVEALERTAIDTSSACRQVVQCLPPDGQFCSLSDLDTKVHDVRNETQEHIAMLGDTLTRELAQTIASQIASQTASVASTDELNAWQEKLNSHEKRLDIMENASRSFDLESLAKDGTLQDGLQDALTQMATRVELLESKSSEHFNDVDRSGMLVRSEIDVMRSLQKLTGTNLEAVQERLQQLEQRSSQEATGERSDARLEDLKSFAMTLDTLAAGFVEVRADVDSQGQRIEQMGEDLLRAGQVQNEGLEAVSEGIKDYIMNLIMTMDGSRSERPCPSPGMPPRDEMVLSARSHNTGAQSVPHSVVSQSSRASVSQAAHIASPGSGQISPPEFLNIGGSGLYRPQIGSPQLGVVVRQSSNVAAPKVPAVRVATTAAPVVGSPGSVAYPRGIPRRV